jgi:gliding motility-associated-like protein
MEKYMMQIYNRWGQLLFTTLQSGNGWDGTNNGREVESGTYYYRISAIPADKSKGNIELRGDIALIR